MDVAVECMEAFEQPDAGRTVDHRNFEVDQRGGAFREISNLIEYFRGVEVIKLCILCAIRPDTRAFIKFVEGS